MKNRISTSLSSIKTNNEIVQVLNKSKKMNLPYISLWIGKQSNKSLIQYALLVNKTQFKTAVTRNKIKRQLRNILITSELGGGLKILFKPNATYLKWNYQQIKEQLINVISKYQNGK